MKKYLYIFLMMTVLVAAIIAPSLAPYVIGFSLAGATAWFCADAARGFRRSNLVPAVNSLPGNVGSSAKSRRYKATAALATRGVFVKAGASDEYIAAITATSDKPIGVIDDQADAAGEGIVVELSGINGRTIPCVAGAAIAVLNSDVYTDATGKVVVKPTAAGTYWKVGRNLTLAGAANDPVEVQLCEPEKLIVVSALDSTNGTAGAAADLAALKAEVEKLGDDFRKFAVALDANANVAIATT